MKARVKWLGSEGMSFLGESGSGHVAMMDGAPEAGGRDLAPRPMELVLMGTGGCTCFDVVLILKRSRADVRDCVVEIEAERAETDPKVFTRIHMHFTVSGSGLRTEQVKRAIDLSATKYCSASIMLAKTATITHDFTLVDVGGAA
ncbi:MAG: OsmC family protein [Pseudomonadota bacterium]|nr:OsmC family protein [Pseudomonadota bacterium]